jgi:outer membrane cobalamin receptor
LNKANTFKVSYSKRVRRPNEWQLNPFGDYDDPTSIRVGNPYLTPEYTHSAEVSYSRLGENYTITLAPYVRYTVDEISWRERITEEGVTILTFENFDTEESYGAELIGSLTLGDWLKSNASMNAYKRVTEAGTLSSELSNDAIGFRTRLSATAEIRPDLQLQLSQSYRSPMTIPGGRIAAEHRTDLALQQKVLSGRASLNLRVRDLFGAPNELIERDLERYYQEYFQERNSRSLQLSFRYTFGQDGDSGDRGRRSGRR